MTNIKCPCAECKYNKNLRCGSKKITLEWRNMATVNEGWVGMWVCKEYELSEEMKRMMKNYI